MNRLRSTLAVACFVSLGACDPGSKDVTATAGIDDEGSASGSGSGGSAESGSEEAGEESSGTGGDYGGRCEETKTELLSINDIGPTGIVPSEVLAEAEGTYTGSLRWLADEGPVLYQGPVGPTPVEIEVAYAGGVIYDVEAELVEPCMHDGPCPCEDRLEIHTRFRITSEDGALDETWTVVLNHQPVTDYFSPPGTSMYHRFEPDATVGSLSRASFELAADVVLNEMVMTGEFVNGSLQGGLNVDVTGGGPDGWAGFGSVANFAGVTSLDACPGLSGDSCAAAGCTTVAGTPVYGQDASCSCGDAEELCFGGPLVGDPIPTLYTRPDRYEEGNDLVYLLDTAVAELPAPWRACADAPEVPSCSCSGECG